MPSSHPDKAQLSDFALGKLDAGALDGVENHLAECSVCCDTLRQLKDDTFVGLVRNAGPANVTPAADHGARTVDQATLPPRSVSGGATADTDHDQASFARETAGLPPELADHPRYRVVELLGKGGMGNVYKAEHRLMQRHVALKVINPRLVASRSAVDRFRREVQAAARLHHPNIVTAFDAEQAGDLHFLVMEHVEGTDLSQVLEKRGPLPVAEACDYVRQAALGLQHAMESGMVHRDIKPHNLMVQTGNARQGGRIKILDFGLASLATETPLTPETSDGGPAAAGLTQAGAIMGTPDYMAPEQAKDAHAADIRADIYSLGCTLYHLLSGQVPFPDGSALDKVMAHTELTPRPLGQVRTDLPPGLEEVVARMMHRDPARRFHTPAEVAWALRPFCGDRASAGASKVLIWGIAAAVALVLALAGIIAMVAMQGTPQESITLKNYAPPAATITKDGVKVEGNAWRIDVKQAGAVRLFELPDPGIDEGQVTYRAKIKTEKLKGKAYLEMWLRFPGVGEFFSKGLQNPVQGTTDWASYEVPFFLKKGERPDLLKLNVRVEGTGTLWIKDVEVGFKGTVLKGIK